MRNDTHIRSHPFIHDNLSKKKFQTVSSCCNSQISRMQQTPKRKRLGVKRQTWLKAGILANMQLYNTRPGPPREVRLSQPRFALIFQNRTPLMWWSWLPKIYHGCPARIFLFQDLLFGFHFDWLFWRNFGDKIFHSNH